MKPRLLVQKMCAPASIWNAKRNPFVVERIPSSYLFWTSTCTAQFCGLSLRRGVGVAEALTSALRPSVPRSVCVPPAPCSAQPARTELGLMLPAHRPVQVLMQALGAADLEPYFALLRSSGGPLGPPPAHGPDDHLVQHVPGVLPQQRAQQDGTVGDGPPQVLLPYEVFREGEGAWAHQRRPQASRGGGALERERSPRPLDDGTRVLAATPRVRAGQTL